MHSLLLTLAGFAAGIAAVQGLFWMLFRRKMEPLRFPSERDDSGSYDYYQRRLRIFMLIYTAGLIGFCWFFLSILW